MTIPQRLIAGTLVPALVVWGFAMYLAREAETVFRGVIERTSAAQASALLSEIDRILAARVAGWCAYSQSPAVQSAVSAAKGDIGRPRPPRGGAEAQVSSPARSETDQSLAGKLQQRRERENNEAGAEVFTEVWITDCAGEEIARAGGLASGPHGQSEAWRKARRHRRFIGDVRRTPHADGLIATLGLRIDDDDGDFAGVLAVRCDLRDIIAEIDRRTSVENAYRTVLLSSRGEVIHDTLGRLPPLLDAPEYHRAMSDIADGSVKVVEGIDRESQARLLSAYAVSSRHGQGAPHGWVLVRELDADSILAPLTVLERDLVGLAVVATLIVVLVGGRTAMTVSRRVTALARATDALGRGETLVRADAGGTDELGRLGQRFNEMADKLHAARTTVDGVNRDLAQRNRQLQEEIAERAEAERMRLIIEEHLREAQKLQAIGQLAAGVAHEINTPIQYVGDNTTFLRDSLAPLWPVLAEIEPLLGSQRATEALGPTARALHARLAELDLGYLKDEVPSAIEQSLDGVARVAEIVRAMKEFSHPGSDREKTPTDLNRAVRSTVTVARNEWKYVADVELDLEEDLPSVPCFPGAINQVVLNLIVNAAHAIEARPDRTPDVKGRITVKTQRAEDYVTLSVSDTGTGIPEEVRSRIFEPFFTTKDVGKGTGQGLSIAHAVVVQQHGGTIGVESEEGVGSTFTLRVPLQEASTCPIEDCFR